MCTLLKTTRRLNTNIQVNIMGAWYLMYNEHIYTTQSFFLYLFYTSGQAADPKLSCWEQLCPLVFLAHAISHGWVFTETLAIFSQGRSPAWQTRSFRANCTTQITRPHLVHTDKLLYITNHIKCIWIHNKYDCTFSSDGSDGLAVCWPLCPEQFFPEIPWYFMAEFTDDWPTPWLALIYRKACF
jgi:hypothetical protein